MDLLFFVISIASLIIGADIFIKQSEKIAHHLSIPQFVIGATLVALGTSLPEMGASVMASISGKPEIAIGNVLGSNVFNITFVLGLVLLLAKTIKPTRDFFAKDSIWIMLPVILFVLMVLDDEFSRFDGIILMILMVAYVMFLLQDTQNAKEAEELVIEDTSIKWISVTSLIVLGISMVLVGAHFAVDSASSIATSLGVSQWVIGIILISFGTSLPELVVSVVAAIKNKADMAIGNIIGSNMANVAVVLGVSATVKPMPLIATNYIFDIITLVAVSLLLVLMVAGKNYTKPFGIGLLLVLTLFVYNIAGQL